MKLTRIQNESFYQIHQDFEDQYLSVSNCALDCLHFHHDIMDSTRPIIDKSLQYLKTLSKTK